MRIALRAKFFLALALLLAVVLVMFLLLSRWGLQRSLGAYVAEIELARLDWLVEVLQREHAQPGGWETLRTDPQAWRQLLRPGALRGPRGDPPPHASGPGGAPDRDEAHRPPPWPETGPGHRHDAWHGPAGWRPPEGARPGGGPRGQPPPLLPPGPASLPGRLALLDADGALVAGPAPDATMLRRPLYLQDRLIGTLLLAPPDGLATEAEQAFLRGQSLFLAGAGLAGLLLALGLSGWAARRWLLQPLEQLRAAAGRLAGGDLQARVRVPGQDELAQLAESFNRMAGQLAALEDSRSTWLAATSHELRTPLAALQAEIEALQDGVRHFDRGTADRLHAQVLRLARLVDDLRLVTHERYGLPEGPELVWPLQLLLDQAQALQARAAQAGLRIEGLSGLQTLQAQGTVRGHGDRLRLEQVWANLLENAVRYTDAGGQVRLSASVTPGWLSVRVEDSAPAPAAGDYGRLFERFWRGDPSRARASGGAGLGLSICRAIVLGHGGRIQATASALGGLCVQVDLPLQEAPA